MSKTFIFYVYAQEKLSPEDQKNCAPAVVGGFHRLPPT